MGTINSNNNLDAANKNGTPAPAGFKGRFLESVITSGSAFSASDTAIDITNITLTPGTWLITGAIGVSGSTFTGTQIQGWTSETSGNSTTGLVMGSTANSSSLFPVSASDIILSLPSKIYSVGSNTDIYLKTKATYTVLGDGLYYGTIRAMCIA